MEPLLDAVLGDVRSSIDDPGLRDYFDFHRHRFAYTLDLILARVPVGAEVLDVGYFPGYLARALEQLGYRVTGVSSPGIAFNRADVHLLDIEGSPLPFDSDRFDAVVFVETIEHLPHSPVFALTEMQRVARHRATMVVTTPNLVCGSNRIRFLLGQSPMFPLDAYFDADGHGAPLEHRHNREYTLEELRRVIGAAGWQVQDSGYFISYAKWLRREEGWGLRTSVRELSKFLAERAVPSSRDSLFAVARKP